MAIVFFWFEEPLFVPWEVGGGGVGVCILKGGDTEPLEVCG